jgi:YidC/Oxa1 family membrane protein insertase
MYARFRQTPPPKGSGRFRSNFFSGVGLYEKDGDGYKYKSFSFKSLGDTPVESKQTGGWVAMVQHYFVAAIIPPADAGGTYSSKAVIPDPLAVPLFQAQFVGDLAPVDAGAERSFPLRLYIGPQTQDTLPNVASHFNLIEDYGWWTWIALVLFDGLTLLHKLTGNWGWSIVLLTCLVRLAFYPLSAAQYRSMAKMRKYGPRIAELRERFADDRERLNKAMMDLYKKEGFNPLAGCWPLLIQMPVFLGLYQVLSKSVELRQAPFCLWIHDLSAQDPYYVLPVLYGATMWVQQRLSGQNATMDPMQQKMMNIMPIVMTSVFLFFPSGLVLYWLVSNSIGILQQWIITRRLEKEGLGRK